MTNEEKAKAFDWLAKNVEYFEHSINGIKCRDIKIGAYWPQADDDVCPDSNLTDLDFTEYVQAMIEEEERANIIPPYQQRVIDEYADLNGKLTRLIAFIQTPFFGQLSSDEQKRLHKQSEAMVTYANILSERIHDFHRKNLIDGTN